MARLLVSFALLLALGAAAAVPSAGAKAKPVATVKASGAIVLLGPKRIGVGHLSCSLAHSSPSVHRFVISDTVAITCRGGILSAIRVVPSASGHTSLPPTTTTTPVSTTPAAHPAGSFTVTNSFASPTDAAATETGPIAAFDGSQCPTSSAITPNPPPCGSITVGPLTCTFPAFVYDTLIGSINGFTNELVAVGQTVSLTCRGSSLASISRSGLGT